MREPSIKVGVLNAVYARLTDCDQDVQDRMGTLLGKVSSRIQAAAVRRSARQAPRLATAQKAVE